VLGGLNEGIWPQAVDTGPWLNRPMRQELGLSPLEARIGDLAHIFTSLLAAERVYLTRAVKVGGVPTVPSRFLMRLSALIEDTAQPPVGPPARLGLAGAKEQTRIAGPVPPPPPPTPRPPVALRPRRLGITAVGQWIANPYALFASRILALQPLPPLGRPPDA